VQLAVDTKHDLILVTAVTRDKNDRGQLFPMAQKTREVLTTLQQTMGNADLNDKDAPTDQETSEEQNASSSVAIPPSDVPEKEDESGQGPRADFSPPEVAEEAVASPSVGLTVLADAGYHAVSQLEACETNGIVAFVPNQGSTSGRSTNGDQVFPKEMFRYEPAGKHYVCPTGKILSITAVYTDKDQKVRLTFSNSKACQECQLKAHCTKSDFRKISRMQNDAVTERTAARVSAQPEKISQRKTEIEHVFGNLKNDGHDILLTRGIKNVTAEVNLSALAYNLRRCLNVVGVAKLLEAIGKIAHILRPPSEDERGNQRNINQLATIGVN
jgi:transposase